MKERQYDMTHEEKMKLLIDEKYPLSAKYDPEWIYENKMGCQCLWLVESPVTNYDLKTRYAHP